MSQFIQKRYPVTPFLSNQMDELSTNLSSYPFNEAINERIQFLKNNQVKILPG